MSAFICSDKHISSLVTWFTNKTSTDNIGKHAIADKLKQVNIESVNYRYGESTPITKCSFEHTVEITNEMAYSMAQCLNYQSCEKPNYKNPLLKAITILADKLRDKSIKSDVWELY